MKNFKPLLEEVFDLMFKDSNGLLKLLLLIFTIVIAQTMIILMPIFLPDVVPANSIMLILFLGTPFIGIILISYLIGLFWKNTIQGEKFTFKTIFNVGGVNVSNFLTLCMPFIILALIFFVGIFSISEIPYFREAAASDSTGALIMLLPAILILCILLIIFIPFVAIVLNSILLKEKKYFECISLSIKTYNKNKKLIVYVLGIGIISILISLIPIVGIIGPLFFGLFSIGIVFLSLQKK